MKPQFELPKLGDITDETIYYYECLEDWLRSGDDTPWVNHLDPVMGLFGDRDELFSFYDSFKKRYPKSYYIKSSHRPTIEAFTENIKTKIKEFFN